MKWEQNKPGDERTRHKFCVLPFRDGEHVHWLKWITVVERYWWEEAYGGGWDVIRVL